MKKTFACAVRPNKAPSMRRGLSIISLEHSYGLNGSRIFDRTQLAPLGTGTGNRSPARILSMLECLLRIFYTTRKMAHGIYGQIKKKIQVSRFFFILGMKEPLRSVFYSMFLQ